MKAIGDCVKELREEGLSLDAISNELAVGKSTAYYHLRKHFGRSYKQVTIKNDDEGIGEFLGMFTADGSYNKSRSGYIIRLYFSKDEKVYVDRVIRLLNNLFDKKPSVFHYKNRNLIEIRYVSKNIYNLIVNHLSWGLKKTYSVRMKKLHGYSNDFIIGFLRGYLDCDGFCYEKYPKLSYFGVSEEMLRQIYDMVSSLGLNPSFYRHLDKRDNRVPMNFVHLKKEEAIQLISIIKPRNPKRFRGWARGDLNSGIA